MLITEREVTVGWWLEMGRTHRPGVGGVPALLPGSSPPLGSFLGSGVSNTGSSAAGSGLACSEYAGLAVI